MRVGGAQRAVSRASRSGPRLDGKGEEASMEMGWAGLLAIKSSSEAGVWCDGHSLSQVSASLCGPRTDQAML